LTDVADVLAKRISPATGEPYALFGHSMGALLAFEVARRFRDRRQAPPVVLYVSGRQAPHLPTQTRLSSIASDDEFLVRLGKRYGGVPAALVQDRRLRQAFLPLLRADIDLVESYRYCHAQPLGTDIVAFGGTDDTSVSNSALAAWRAHTSAAFSMRLFTGGHFFVNQSRPEVIGEIGARLSHPSSPGATCSRRLQRASRTVSHL
jgi:surfactin synthase thioesterase subunit